MKLNPFFSIVIPCYNRSKFLPATLSSVFSQTFDDYEVIIVDDGSTDNTKEIIEREFDTPKLIYHWQENTERGAARNKGIELAKGKYVLFFDSDDLMHSNHLSILYQNINSLDKVNFIATKHDWLRNGKKEPSTIEKIAEGWYDKTIFIEGNGLACNFCINKDNPKLKKFQEDRKLTTMEDWIFLLENLVEDKIYITKDITITLNDHDTRSLTMNPQNTIRQRLFATEWVKKNIFLTIEEHNKLEGYSYMSCAVFSYIDNKTIQSLKYSYKAFQFLGLKKAIVLLFLKNIAAVSKLKKLLSKWR